MIAATATRFEEAYELLSRRLPPAPLAELSRFEYDLVIHVPADGGRSLQWLAGHFGMPVATCRYVVRGLERAGYLESAVDPAARRRTTVTLGPKGRQVVAARGVFELTAVRAALSTLTVAERVYVVELMERLAESSTRVAAEFGRVESFGFIAPHRGFGTSEARTEAEQTSPARSAARDAWGTLSASERHIAEMVGDGLSNAEIASRLALARSTVYGHISSIYAKLAISSRIQLERLVEQQRSCDGDRVASAAERGVPPTPHRPPETLELARRFEEAWREIWLRLKTPDTPSFNDHLIGIVRNMSPDDPESVLALAERFTIPYSAFVHLVGVLEEQGYVVRFRDPADQRRFLVRHTARGLREATRKPFDGPALHAAMRALGAVASTELADLLHRLTAGAGYSAVQAPRSVNAPAAAGTRGATVVDGAGVARARPSRRVREHGLSRTERRVAALAAEGFSNKAIADTLFVSDATVVTHLGHVYRKLGVTSRAELAARLSADSS